MDKIIIKGASEHNLKNIDVEIPRDKLIVFTGLSGSGKSSLMYCLSTLKKATDGDIVYNGKNYKELTGKELELLKLYCVLCGSRHSFTSEVIKEDVSGIYQSNNYKYNT